MFVIRVLEGFIRITGLLKNKNNFALLWNCKLLLNLTINRKGHSTDASSSHKNSPQKKSNIPTLANSLHRKSSPPTIYRQILWP
jgi:hypothetical protein